MINYVSLLTPILFADMIGPKRRDNCCVVTENRESIAILAVLGRKKIGQQNGCILIYVETLPLRFRDTLH